MKTTTRRLPRTLKKKLEANLISLTPRQAGRLWLIYFLEVARKKEYPLDQYPPVKELFDAWEKRYAEARKKSTEEGIRVGALYSGFIFLTNLAREANRNAMSDSWRVVAAIMSISELVGDLIQRDWVSEVARRSTSALIDQAPLPVSREDYRVMIDWAEGEALEGVDDATDTIMAAWAKSQGFVDLDEDPEENVAILHRLRPEEVAAIFDDLPESEQGEALRRLRADVSKEHIEGLPEEFQEGLLGHIFKGDREALEDWVKTGGFAGPGLTADKWNARYDEIEKQLVDLVKAGDLEGGQATYPDDCFDAVLIEGGKIPAWAVLRSTWRRWLYDHDYFVKDTPTLTPDTIRGVWEIYNAEGDVEEDEDLADLARAFFEDCKAKPWGEDLVESSQADFDALGRFLIEDANPLTQYHAPDLGFVDLEAFEAAEEEDIRRDWVATVRSLKAKAADFGVKPEDFDRDWVKEYYYPTDKPEDRREAIATVARLLRALRVSHRAFTYGRKDEDPTKTPMNTFFGESFTTPLELAVKTFGEVFGILATFKRTHELISEEYFGGFDLLMPEAVDNVDLAEALLFKAEDDLQDWLHRIEDTWPDVDLSPLRLVKADADEERAKEAADLAVMVARRDTGESRGVKIDLGPEDDVDKAAKARKNSQRKPEPVEDLVEVTVNAEGGEEE